MAVTKPRLLRFPASRLRDLFLVTVLSPFPAGGAANGMWRLLPGVMVAGGRAVVVSSLHPPLPAALPAIYLLHHFRIASFTPPPMATAVPSQIPVPPFLEPVLSYISSSLPPPVYSALLTLLAHGMAFFSALIGLGSALISSKPSDWAAQKIIPPLITLLAAYLALASAVRTATWFVRMTAWLVKWGIITAAVSAALAWVLGAGNGGGGIVPSLIAMVLDKTDGQRQSGAAGDSRGSRQRSRPRPQAWESFDQHWEWQFEEQQWNAADAASPAAHVQQFVADALDRARDGSWLSIARGALQSFSTQEQTREDEGEPYGR